MACGRLEANVAVDPEDRAVRARGLDAAVGADDQWRRVARNAEAHGGIRRARVDLPVHRRAELHRPIALSFEQQRRVEVGEDLGGPVAEQRRGADRVPRQRGHAGRFRALAAHVAEEEADPFARQREQVVEVAAHLLRG